MEVLLGMRYLLATKQIGGQRICLVYLFLWQSGLLISVPPEVKFFLKKPGLIEPEPQT